jgi:cobalt-zinc-cadmium efflux system protein
MVSSVVMLAEFVGGIIANSLALLADAGHMLTDVAAVALALLVAWIAQRPATPQKTYGYLRLEILAALVNGSALFIIAGSIIWEAIHRLGTPPDVEPRILLSIATLGLVANLISMKLLHGGQEHSLNVRGAYLHVISDLLGSVGAMAAGAVIWVTGWTLADPIISVFVALLILGSAWRLVRDSVEVLLEATPKHIEVGEVEGELRDIPGVSGVHDLHVWTVTSGVVAMSGHVCVDDPEANQRVLEDAQQRMDDLGIHHITIQIERGDGCEVEVVSGSESPVRGVAGR